MRVYNFRIYWQNMNNKTAVPESRAAIRSWALDQRLDVVSKGVKSTWFQKDGSAMPAAPLLGSGGTGAPSCLLAPCAAAQVFIRS